MRIVLKITPAYNIKLEIIFIYDGLFNILAHELPAYMVSPLSEMKKTISAQLDISNTPATIDFYIMDGSIAPFPFNIK